MILNLDNNDINIVMDVLSQGPFRAVAPVIQKIQMQIIAQQQPAAQSVDTPADPVPAGGTD